MNFKSNFLKTFVERGFYNNCTHPKELDDLLAKQEIKAYIGFDCTAKSLHVGSLMQIMTLRMLQKTGHTPIILLGGGTTKIGDPSGKDEARKFLSNEEIEENLKGIRQTLEKFLVMSGKNSTIVVNNDAWLQDLSYIDFLRNTGKHFTINKMLTFDSVKTRLEREQPLTFLEFNYMILQAYDFFELNKQIDCKLQIGGSDQWGNIVNGVDLTRKIGNLQNEKNQVFGLTTDLLTTADGKKMGKTADGAVWLDEKMLSPYDYFQYFRNVDDSDVSRFLKLFTDLELGEIEKLEKLEGQDINHAKEILAFETTKICHGEEKAKEAESKTVGIVTSSQARGAIVAKPAYLPASGTVVGEHASWSGGKGAQAGGVPDGGDEAIIPLDGERGGAILAEALAPAIAGAILNELMMARVGGAGAEGGGSPTVIQDNSTNQNVTNNTIVRTPSPSGPNLHFEGRDFVHKVA